MVDVLWIIFNILIWLGMCLIILKLILFISHRTNLYIKLLIFICIIILPNNININNKEKAENSSMENYYYNNFSLNPIQNMHLLINAHTQKPTQYQYYINGICGMGINWGKMVLSGHAVKDGFKYCFYCNKVYTILGVPIYSKTEQFNGVAKIKTH